MEKQFIRKTLSSILLLTALATNIPYSLAGGKQTKQKPYFSPEQRSIISNPKYLPYYAEDGGRAYFNAWNGINEGNDFKLFLEKYSHMIENERSATELKDSRKSDEWSTGPVYGYSFALNELREYPSDEYLLRVDYEHKIVYAIRKSGHTYLCTFYILHISPKNKDEVRANLAYQFVLSPTNNVTKLLLPIDRHLLDKSCTDL